MSIAPQLHLNQKMKQVFFFLFIIQMKKESQRVNNQNHSQVEQLQANSQLISIIEKKIEEETQKKINQLHIINIDQFDENGSKCLVKIDKQQFSQNQSNDQEYRPENDVSSSQSVQKYKFHRLRLRELKIITKRQFQRKLLPNQPIYILDDSEHSSANNHKKQYVKVNFKQEVKGRITKKTKMEFLFTNKGKVVSKTKNKKRVKALHYQLNNQSD